jgi:hypothetical protein
VVAPLKKLGIDPGEDVGGAGEGEGAGGFPIPKPNVFFGPSSALAGGVPKLNDGAGLEGGCTDASVASFAVLGVGGEGGGAVMELLANGDEALGLELMPGARRPSEGLLGEAGGAEIGAGATGGAGLRRLISEGPSFGASDRSPLARVSSSAISFVIFSLP